MDEQSQGMQGPPIPQFQPQKALRPDMGYNTLANFRIEKKIGRGQFSEVYRAACLLDGVPVALKKVMCSALAILLQVCLLPVWERRVCVLNACYFLEIIKGSESLQYMATLTNLFENVPVSCHGSFAKK
uniref:NEK6-subfamily protein kinase n=1 Tax=Mandrillus leucophaeus TaxID=9568 RepID=A0A2K5Y4X7_MANLE